MTLPDYLDLDLAIEKQPEGYIARVIDSPSGQATCSFSLPFSATELAQFIVAVGPPRVTSRRLVPTAARETDVRDYGRRLSEALFAGEVGTCFRLSVDRAQSAGRDLRIRLRLSAVPELDSIPWEYLFDTQLSRFITLSKQTPIIRYLESPTRAPGLTVEPPLRVLAMISSPSDAPGLDVAREVELLKATTGDLVATGLLELVFLEDATLLGLQHALYDRFHVFHFVGHGGFDNAEGEGVLVLENESGTSHRVSGSRLGTLLHDAADLQLAVLNACEGARTSGQDAFSGVGQTLIRQGLPAVVAMQVEISDRAALTFSHEFYFALSRGKPIEAAMCEARKAMATSDAASEWGTPVLLRSAADQPFVLSANAQPASPRKEERLQSLYAAAGHAISTGADATALPILEQLALEQPDYQNVTALLARVRPPSDQQPAVPAPGPPTAPTTVADPLTPPPLLDRAGDSTGSKPVPQPTVPQPSDPRESLPQPPDPRNRPWLKIGAAAATLVLAGTAYFVFTSPADTTADPGGSSSPGPAEVAQACGPEVAPPEVDNANFAQCTVNDMDIDGDFSDWDSPEIKGFDSQVFPVQATSADLSAQWQVAWNKDALYLHAIVENPVLRPVEVSQPSQFFKGDSVSFEFGPDPRRLGPSSGLRNGRDVHLMLGLTGDGLEASVNPTRSGQFVAGSSVAEVAASLASVDGGYEVEAAVPWSVLNVDSPTQGQVFGMNLNVSDATPEGAWGLRAMISSNPDRTGANQPRPGTWQRLVLSTAPSS